MMSDITQPQNTGAAGRRVRQRAFRTIVEEIREDVLAGRRRAGDRLPPEQVLAEQFNVSRTGVREALRVLESEGLVEIRHGYSGGVFVAPGGLDPVLGALRTSLQRDQVQVSELYEARMQLEPAIARRAAERRDEEMLERLRANAERAKAAIANGSDAFAINLEFHAVLAQAAGNRVMALVMQVLVELLEKLDREYPTNRGVSRRAVDDHVLLVEALQGADGGRAERLMLEHLRDLEHRFERIQEQMARRRSGVRSIPPWGGRRLEPPQAGYAEEAR